MADQARFAELAMEHMASLYGAAGALLSDLGFSWKIVRGILLVARAAGMVGHLAEEQEHPIGWAVWREIEQRVTYTAPADQPA